MITMLQDLIRHQGHVNASMLRAIRRHEATAQDLELRRLMHHILLANRFWLALTLGQPFALEAESQVPGSIDTLAGRFQETHTRELAWILGVQESDLARRIETPFFPGSSFSVEEAWMQVCMHSHGHRSQCATRLRSLGGTPSSLDFILWLKDRPAAEWT